MQPLVIRVLCEEFCNSSKVKESSKFKENNGLNFTKMGIFVVSARKSSGSKLWTSIYPHAKNKIDAKIRCQSKRNRENVKSRINPFLAWLAKFAVGNGIFCELYFIFRIICSIFFCKRELLKWETSDLKSGCQSSFSFCYCWYSFYFIPWISWEIIQKFAARGRVSKKPQNWKSHASA